MLMKKMTFGMALAMGGLGSAAGAEEPMRLTSPQFVDRGWLGQEAVYQGFGCSGGNLSPALEWTGAPAGTKSFVVTAYDPDAPTGSGWWHWTVFNLPAEVSGLEQGAGSPGGNLPADAVQGRNDFSTNEFGGACPPKGADPHRYVFTVFAMPDATLPIGAESSGAMVGFFAENMSLSRASLTAYYGR